VRICLRLMLDGDGDDDDNDINTASISSRKFRPQPLSSCLASKMLTRILTLMTPVNGCFLPDDDDDNDDNDYNSNNDNDMIVPLIVGYCLNNDCSFLLLL